MRARGGRPGWRRSSPRTRSNSQVTRDQEAVRRGESASWEKPAPSLTDQVTPGKAELCRLPGLGAETPPWPPGTRHAVAAPSPPPGKSRPQPRTAQDPLLSFLSSRTASGCHPDPLPQPLRPRPTNPRIPAGLLAPLSRTLPSPSAGAQRCSPIVRSPEPGLLGAPSRGRGRGKGRRGRSPPSPGAASQATAAACAASLRWLRRRPLTAEVTHRPSSRTGPQPRPCPYLAHGSGIGCHIDEGRKPSGKRPESD